ncbi:hypothetical protein MTO96_041946, partial [Rhipicephalus appendiculatus]
MQSRRLLAQHRPSSLRMPNSPCGYAIKYPPGWKVPTLKSFQE